MPTVKKEGDYAYIMKYTDAGLVQIGCVKRADFEPQQVWDANIEAEIARLEASRNA
jgi:hypothetical protein